ncbi:MAG: hypothetical protein VZQ62_06195 [Methanosphaera sp.]|nr:hypothetical protein [Methanosphaera sp.]
MEIEEIEHKLTRSELIDYARYHQNNSKLYVDENANVINNSIVDFSEIQIGEAEKRYDLETLHYYVAIYDEKKKYNVYPNGTMDLVPRVGVDMIMSNKFLTGYVNYFNLNIRNSIQTLSRVDLMDDEPMMWMRPDFEFKDNVMKPIPNLLFYGMYLDKSKIQVIDPEIELSELDIISAKANNDGKITIDDPRDPFNPNQVLKLYYPITIDVSQIVIQRVTPTIRLSIAQLQTKTHFPVSEMTNGAFDATNNIDLISPLKLQPLTVNTIVRYNEVNLNKLIITDNASRHNIDGITNYENTLTLPLDDKEIIITNTNSVTFQAITDSLIGYDKVTVKPQLKLEPVHDFHVPTYNDLTNNHYKYKKTAKQFNPELIGITEIDLDVNLNGLLETKTITVNEGSNTTILAKNDNCLGYEEVTIKVKGNDDPDSAPAVVYPIPITAFGIYQIKPIYCIPPATRCSSITFTYADLTAAVVAGGVMGLLPSLIPATATITENGQYTYLPDEYPIPQPAQNVAYSSFIVNVNVPQPQPSLISGAITKYTNGSFTLTAPEGYDGYNNYTINIQVPNQTEEKTITSNGTYTPSNGHIGFSKVTVNVPIPTFNTQTKTITSNGTYTPSSGYDGFSQVTVNVPIPTFNTQTKTITSNGTYTPSSGYDGFSQVTVNVSNNLIGKIITSNGVYYPDSPYDGFYSVNVQVNPKLQIKEITSNGTYTPDTGNDGFSSVTVNVTPEKRTLGKIIIGSNTVNLFTTNFNYNNISNSSITMTTINTLIKITPSSSSLIFELFKPTVYNNATFPIEYGCYYKLLPYTIDSNTNITYCTSDSNKYSIFRTNAFYNTNDSNAYLYSKITILSNFYNFPTFTYTPDM